MRGAFGVEIDDILGSSIHLFHKDPTNVERILKNPKALPYETKFVFGKITLETRINSIPAEDGTVLGYVVAWEDVTYRQRLELDYAGQIAAIHRSQAVIEFELDGTIIHANENFLKTVGYNIAIFGNV
jgi:methyl-accepting chemotaxis protein